MRIAQTISPASHHVCAVLEAFKGIFLSQGADVNVAQQTTAAPLSELTRAMEVIL